MNYKPTLGIFGNLKLALKTITLNKLENDNAILEIYSDMVEAVVDEFNALIGEESEE